MTPQEAELFIRNFSHEIKNPLTTIKGYSQLLKVKGADAAFVDKVQSIISGEVKRIEDSFSCFYSLFSLSNVHLEDVSAFSLIRALSLSLEEPVENLCAPDAVLRTNSEIALQAVGLVVKGFRWDDYPGSSVVISASDGDGKCRIQLSFSSAFFSSLDETSFAIPYASGRFFSTGTELFSAQYLLSKIGGGLSISDDRAGFEVVLS
jgi:hypothetical protein